MPQIQMTDLALCVSAMRAWQTPNDLTSSCTPASKALPWVGALSLSCTRSMPHAMFMFVCLQQGMAAVPCVAPYTIWEGGTQLILTAHHLWRRPCVRAGALFSPETWPCAARSHLHRSDPARAACLSAGCVSAPRGARAGLRP